MNLFDYIRQKTLDEAAEVNGRKLIEMTRTIDPATQGVGLAVHPSLAGLVILSRPKANALCALASAIKGGAKVIKPSLDLCRALLSIDLNLHVEDYVQPYEGLCVVIPAAAIGLRMDVLAASYWRPGIGVIIGSITHPLVSSLALAEGSAGTIEEMLSDPDRSPGQSQEAVDWMSRLARIVMNASLFGVERGVRVRPYDPRSKERARRADRAGRRGYEARVVEIQDLDLILRTQVPHGLGGEDIGGWRQPLHRRRGHWKMQPCGPGRSQRKRIFVHSYLVHANDDPDAEVQSILS